MSPVTLLLTLILIILMCQLLLLIFFLHTLLHVLRLDVLYPFPQDALAQGGVRGTACLGLDPSGGWGSAGPPGVGLLLLLLLLVSAVAKPKIKNINICLDQCLRS